MASFIYSIAILLFARLILGETGIEELPTDGAKRKEMAMTYLRKYGYYGPLKPDPDRHVDDVGDLMMSDMISEFQVMADLPATGELDSNTLLMMTMPRCGVSDKVTMGDASRRKRRYVLQGSKWGKTDLTYRIVNYTPDLPRQAVDYHIERAFQVWANVTPLSFSRTSGQADIEIQFGSFDHGDGYPFDGSGGTLAHAFFPSTSPIGGDTHFDEHEVWTVDVNSGINLFQVAVHEFGHALGLGHSQVREAIMFAFYSGYDPNSRLSSDDIQGIQAIYGYPRWWYPPRPTTTTYHPWPTTTYRPYPTPPWKPELCTRKNPGIDAITSLPNGVFVFQGSNVYKLDNYWIAAGYPVRISQEFPGIPDDLDAVLYWKERIGFFHKHVSQLFFFKGSQYWLYEDGRLAHGYPMRISDGFPGLPNDLDAAFVWGINGYTYFIKGDKYYKFYKHKRASSPRDLKKWRGLPKRVSAAMLYANGRTYFFEKDSDNYYRYADYHFRVDRGYPRSARKVWYGCDKGDLEIGGDLQLRGEGMDEGQKQFLTVDSGSPAMHSRLSVISIVIMAIVLTS